MPDEGNAQSSSATTPVEDQEITLPDGSVVKLSELKGGYLRQQDYTKKTQAIAEERRQLEAALGEAKELEQFKPLVELLRTDPNAAQQVATALQSYQQGTMTPSQGQEIISAAQGAPDAEAIKADILAEIEFGNHLRSFEAAHADEISEASKEGRDFVTEMLEFAERKGLDNLDDAYLIANRDKIIERERQKALEEAKAQASVKKAPPVSGGGAGAVPEPNPKPQGKRSARDLWKEAEERASALLGGR